MEAVVENTASRSPRFYCHTCTIELSSISSDFTCPVCSQGFIEELPALPYQANGPQANSYGSQQYNNDQALRLAGELFSNTFFPPLFRNPNDPRDGEEAGASSGADSGDLGMYAVEDIPIDGTSQPSGAAGGAGGSSMLDAGEGVASGSGVMLFGGDPRPSMRFPGRRGSRRRGMQNINHVDHILREILISVSGGANGGPAGAPVFFMGNPGDYAWGREGIDTIVTQLLNQMDNTGPPPLDKERIAEIPTVTINAQQVEQKLQCSVCFEYFVTDEPVRKLPCMHVYHDPCIIPWLELHGTCPICRKSLSPEQSQASPQSQSQQTQENASGTPPGESSDPSQQHELRQGQQPSTQSQQGVLTIRIQDLLPIVSGPPRRAHLLGEMRQPFAASVSSSSLPQANSNASGSGGGTSQAHGSSASRPNAPSSGSSSSSSGSRTTNQLGNSNRDDDGNIDNTLDLD